MRFKCRIILTKVGLASQLNVKINMTKIVIVAFIVAGLLSLVFYGINQRIIHTLIFGATTGLIAFFLLNGEVSKGLSGFTKQAVSLKKSD